VTRRVLCLTIILVAIALAALAEATPPDQTWISGFYDNADYDDVVLKITSGVSAVDSGLLWSLHPISVVVSIVLHHHSGFIRLAALPSDLSRAPPAA
jgi:hypothetical protein